MLALRDGAVLAHAFSLSPVNIGRDWCPDIVGKRLKIQCASVGRS